VNKIEKGSETFGNAFEHFIYQELYAHSSYTGLDYTISYWRTASQIEIDFVLGNHEVAIEVKSSEKINERHLKGLKSFMDEYNVKHSILVCNEPLPRKHGDIWILPWQIFLQKLWAGELISE